MTAPSQPRPITRSRAMARAAALGLVAGFLSGMFGVGGGILIVPVLVLALGMGQRLAHGTSLASVLPIAVSGLIGYAVEDSVDWPVAVALTVAAMGGAVIGTQALQVLSQKALGYSFSALLLLSAVRLVFDSPDAAGRSPLDIWMVVGFVALGAISGILAGLLGVGGGVIMVPVMVIAFGMPAAVAKGTSLAVIIPTAIIGTVRNTRNRNCDLPIAVCIGVAGVLSAYAASKISVDLDEKLSNQLFAALLAAVAIRMLLTTRKADHEPPAEPDA